jgi:pilus assembly protein CpaE
MMQEAMEVLIAGDPFDDVRTIARVAEQHKGVRVSSADSLREGLMKRPDVLVLVLSGQAEQELQILNQRAAADRVPTILIGPSSDPQILRAALRAGARDYFMLAQAAEELPAALARIASDRRSQSARGQIVGVLNARGGAGASFVAANLAHVLAARADLRVAMVDLDLQFGSLPLYFDLQPNGGLVQALNDIDQLDAMALEAHMLKHVDGVHLLGTPSDHLVVPGEVASARLESLFELLVQSYERVVVDLPRQIDALTAATLQRADRVAIVMQQSLPHLREAKRLSELLQRELELAPERIVIVINRWDKNGPVLWRDIEQALPAHPLVPVRNDFKRVSESISLGTPMAANAGAPVTADLQALAETLGGIEMARPKGLLARLFSGSGSRQAKRLAAP